MKKNNTLLPLLMLCAFPFSSHAQDIPSGPDENSIEYPAGINDADHPCITDREYKMIEKNCAENIALFGVAGAGQKGMAVTSLNWPLKAANGLSDCNFYGISAYVDQNTSAGSVTDYNCGSKTYDGHKGTDISIWPFPFYKMDNNQVQVIAAAAGAIIDKSDGNFDKNCGTNSLTANYIAIQHADGSVALYFHMKKNSLTPKSVGQSVAVGEYLGVVGSSGNSSGPHLHFEVWSGSTAGTRIDPFSGPCNTLNASSWWAAQKPYAGHEILKTSVHTTDAVIPACPDTETLNESSCFSLPFQGAGLPPGAAKFYIFMRYETAGATANLSILNPNGSVFNSWTYTSTTNYSASLKSWTKTLPVTPGTYTFQSNYNGAICSKTFDIVAATVTPGGTTVFCQGNSVALTANAGSSYLWSTGASTQSIIASATGNYTVTVTNANGCSAVSAPTAVTVNPLPPVPTITANGSLLTSSSATGNQWYLNGILIPGAVAKTYTATQNGNYTVVVTTGNGCTSTSAIFKFMSTGTQIISESNAFLVIPNPNNGKFRIELQGESVQTTGAVLEVYNLLGDKIFLSEPGHFSPDVDISAQPNGVYFVSIRSYKGIRIMQVLKSGSDE